MGHVPICAYTLLGGSKGHRVGFRKTRDESVRQHAMDIPAIPELSRRLRTLSSEEEAVRLGYVFGSQVDGGHPRGGGELRLRHGEGGVRPVPVRPIGPSSVVYCPHLCGYCPHAWHSASSRGHRGGRALRITGAYSTGLLILSQVTYECLYVFQSSTKSFLRA